MATLPLSPLPCRAWCGEILTCTSTRCVLLVEFHLFVYVFVVYFSLVASAPLMLAARAALGATGGRAAFCCQPASQSMAGPKALGQE